MIAVTGATGALGRRVVDRLAAAGAAPLRLVVRDADRAPQVPGAEGVTNPGGYGDPAGLQAALAGVDTLYLVSAAGAEKPPQPPHAAGRAPVGRGRPRSGLNA